MSQCENNIIKSKKIDFAKIIPPFNKLKNDIKDRGDEFMVDSWKQAKLNYEESKKSLAMYFLEGKDDVYRMMQVPDVPAFIDAMKKHGMTTWKGKRRPIGLSWSREGHFAFAQYGEDGFRVLLEGRINNPKIIDVPDTIYRNTIYPEEGEIRLKGGNQLYVCKICWERRKTEGESTEKFNPDTCIEPRPYVKVKL